MGDVKLDQPIKQVSILELEAMIASLSGVKQVAVVRYNDVDGKLRTYAFVKVLDNAKIVDEIRIQVKERFGAHEVPEFIQLVQDLPYSKTGKLLRSVLRRIAAEDTDGLESIDAAIDPLLILQIIADSRKCKDSANSSLGKQISDV
jgi:acetyl-CoA synthetase